MSETSSNALQTIIDEFKNISPEITNASIFKKNGEIIASNQISTEEQIKKTIIELNNIADQAETIGGIETLTIQGGDNQLNIISMNNRYLATVSSRAANEKIVKALTHVIVPTVLKLVDQNVSEPSISELPKNINSDDKAKEEKVLPIEEADRIETISPSLVHFSSVRILPEAPVNQFMIERIGGLFVPTDLVRVDKDVISKWLDLYGDKQITQVHIETLEGKTITCRFKVIREPKSNVSGIIQIPDKILQSLQTSKGKLVKVKPVI